MDFKASLNSQGRRLVLLGLRLGGDVEGRCTGPCAGRPPPSERAFANTDPEGAHLLVFTGFRELNYLSS